MMMACNAVILLAVPEWELRRAEDSKEKRDSKIVNAQVFCNVYVSEKGDRIL